jgi:hypothetical protein
LLERCFRTYDKAWTLLAFRETVQSTSSAGRVRIKVDDAVIGEFDISRIVKMQIPPGRVQLDSDGTVYSSVQVKGNRSEAKPDDKGFWIRRTYTRLGEKTPRLNFLAGDLISVKVIVWVRTDRRYVAVEDPLPAGFEPVDLRFKTEEARASTDRDFDFIERRDDRVFASAQLLRPGINEWEYLVRATTAGEFSAPAPWAEEMYAPGVFGRGSAAHIKVTSR